MADPAKYRTKEDVQEWKDRDSILVLGNKLEELGMGTRKKEIEQRIIDEIDEAVEFAENAPFPDTSTAMDYAYSEMKGS